MDELLYSVTGKLTLSFSNWAVVMWAVQVQIKGHQIKYLLLHSFLEVVVVVLMGCLCSF